MRPYALLGILLVTLVVIVSPRPGAEVSAITPPIADGDANCSGKVDSIDALTILRFRAGLETNGICEPAADVDCAIGLSAVDALKVLRYVAGLLGETLVGLCPEANAYELVQLYAGDFERVTEFEMVPGSGDEAVLATQKEAKLHRISLSGAFPPTEFGDLSDRTGPGTELEGLLSFAFSPDFASDSRVYVYYTRGAPEPSVLSRFQVVNGVMDTKNETVVLEIPQYSGYNMGGQIAFDSAGNLLLSVGDAGGPPGKAQDIEQLNGKVLRLKVEGEETYSIPADNPFIGVPGRDEIFAVGFRNPWRMTIDEKYQRIWLGDVGELTWEEVNEVKLGRNYGWDTMEGGDCWQIPDCDPSGFELPRAQFPHILEYTSITGGEVYRGGPLGEMEAWYVYASFYSGEVFALNTSSSDSPLLLNQTPGLLISTFVRLPDGDLGLVNFNGSVYRLQRLSFPARSP
jgi:hypothetical protein